MQQETSHQNSMAHLVSQQSPSLTSPAQHPRVDGSREALGSLGAGASFGPTFVGNLTMPCELWLYPELLGSLDPQSSADWHQRHSRTSMSQALLSFLRGEGPDGAGRSLNEVLDRDDDWWEAKHDFVQWLFPNPLPSRVNPRAPLLSDAVIEVVQGDAEIQANVDRALLRFTQFLGFELTVVGYVLLESWPTSKKRWFSRDTHNGMRLTRVLKFLIGIGREEQAEALVAALLKMCRDEVGCGITPMTRSYWRSTLDTSVSPIQAVADKRQALNA